MNFKPYPAYRESGISRIGRIPAHWTTPRLKFLAKIKNGRDYKDVETQDGGYPVIGSGGAFTRATTYLHEGPSVLLGRKGTIDKPLLLREPFWTVDTMFYTELRRSTDPQFFYYSVQTIEFGALSTNTALPSMAQEDLSNLFMAVPDRAEQEQISAVLDHETAKIDALVAEQKRLIELLKEKRQAVISHAVTKGLDPNVPMKDSTVEWLGKVPEHWVVGALRWYAEIQGGIAKGKDYSDKELIELPYLRVANVQNGYIDLSDVAEIAVSSHEVERYALRAGDVLMNEGGDNDKLGRGAVWRAEIEPCLHQNHVFAIRPGNGLCADWLALFTASDPARSYFYLYSKQSTNLASISSSNVMNCPIPLPCPDEQIEILKAVKQQTDALDAMAAEAQKSVGLLAERRSALISAAVTGKIDVRDWRSPADEYDAEQIPLSIEANR